MKQTMAMIAKHTTAQIFFVSGLAESFQKVAETMAAIIAYINIYLFPPS